MRLSGKGFVTGLRVEFDLEQVEHVNAMLAAAPEKALTVYRRAFGRALDAARVQAAREITRRYDIKRSNLEPEQTIRSAVRTGHEQVVGEIRFAGGKIPLYRFHPSPAQRRYTTRYVNNVSGWRVTTEVSAADNRGQMLRRRTAFIATFQSGHTGIFTRTGKETGTGKAQLRELYGYSVADMLDYAPAREAVQERAAQVARERIDHELLRALEEL